LLVQGGDDDVAKKTTKITKQLAAVSVICEMGEEQPEDFGRNRLKRCDE